MTRDVLARAATARPFRPFTVRLRDGDAVRVPHPEVIFLPPKNPGMVVISKPSGGVRLTDMASITCVEFPEPVERPAPLSAGEAGNLREEPRTQ